MMRNFILKNGKILEVTGPKGSDAEDVLTYLKIVGGESDNITFGNEGVPFTIEEEKAFLERFSENTLYPMFVGRINGEIVSLANMSGIDRPRLRHNSEIGLTVIKKYWNQGVGKAMMQMMIEHAKSSKVIENIYLKVRNNNESAIHLYESFGFKTVGKYPRQMKIWNEYYDTLLMALLL